MSTALQNLNYGNTASQFVIIAILYPMSTTPEYTSNSYFDRLQVQLELNVVIQYKGIMGNTAQNASQGVSPNISAVDTGIKAAMALSGALLSCRPES